MRWLVAAVLAFGLSAAASAHEDAALSIIDACAARLDAQIDVGYARVVARCPELPAALHGSPWARWLPVAWTDADNNLSVQSLGALHSLVVSELALRVGTAAPEVARLRPILAQLAVTEERRGWWVRLQSWLRRVLAGSGPGERDNTFARLFDRVSLSQALLELVSCVTVAMVVALAGFIVVNEWRAAGPRIPRTRRKSGCAAPHPEPPLPMSWRDIEGADAAERPRMLLVLLTTRLTAARRLPSCAALTVRELTRVAQLGDAEDRSRLVDVALAAERLRYSAPGAAPAGLAGVIERGRELLARLDAAAAAAP